jgi:putative hydrolase of the HAD superfamily
VEGRRSLQSVLEELLPKLGYQGNADEVIRYWLLKDSRVNRAMSSLMQGLRRHYPAIGLLISTNQEHNRANYLWEACGLSSLADKMFYSASVGVTKEDPHFFTSIRDEMNCDFRQMLVIDDTPGVILTAQGLGMQTFLFENPEESLRRLQDIFKIY